MGLANSSHQLLWINGYDLVTSDTTILPSEFEVKAKGKNSTIESLCTGVPMICWPFEGDQMSNCRYTCIELGVGMEINGDEDAKRNEVE
ncbi:hypothetical protein WN943_004533 [Citrus x changshan-huyou]